MKHILLVAVMFTLVSGSFAVPPKKRTIGVVANVENVEGVTIDRQRLARLKPGYQFERESISSVAVLKISNGARLQTGTLICTKPGKNACRVEIGGDSAKCSSSCYFVGVGGGVRAQ